jgi:hypothetical protein
MPRCGEQRHTVLGWGGRMAKPIVTLPEVATGSYVHVTCGIHTRLSGGSLAVMLVGFASPLAASRARARATAAVLPAGAGMGMSRCRRSRADTGGCP